MTDRLEELELKLDTVDSHTVAVDVIGVDMDDLSRTILVVVSSSVDGTVATMA